MSLEKITHSKSIIASIGIHAFAVACVSLYFYAAKPTSLELGLGNGNGNRLISLNSINFVAPKGGGVAATKSVSTKPVEEKSRAVVKPDPNAKKVAKTEVQDTVSAQASAVSQSGQVGEGTGSGSNVGGGSVGIGNGLRDFDGGALFGKISTYLTNRLSISVEEDQRIKVRLKISKEGVVVGAELAEGQLDMSTLRKILAVARNIPLKAYWQSNYTMPDDLTIPIFLSSN